MSAKAIREATGKDILNRQLDESSGAAKSLFVTVNIETNWEELCSVHKWLETSRLIAKPDELIKQRGHLGLIAVDKQIGEVKEWIHSHLGNDQQVGNAIGKLRNFIIEPFIAHKKNEEVYVCIQSHRTGDTILFHHETSCDMSDIESIASKLEIPVGHTVSIEHIRIKLLSQLTADKKERVANFLHALYRAYVDLYFTYLEIDSLYVAEDSIHILDLTAKLDATAHFVCRSKWGDVEYPPPFGRDAYPEEAYIADLDARSGASLKFTILNRNGRIWTMVAGGGASVIYSDTICDFGGASELANYGEYSGAPSEQQTYEYAKTILAAMTSSPKHALGKVLIIGGCIANFTNVAATFKGIITALREFHKQLIEHNVSIYVRRAGPNYQEALRQMREFGATLGIPFYVYGPETHMTAICGMALGKRPIPKASGADVSTANLLNPNRSGSTPNVVLEKSSKHDTVDTSNYQQLFHKNTKSIIWGLQTKAIQTMLDFDFSCRRTEPSVAAIVYPFTEEQKHKFYWGQKEVFIPIYKKMSEAVSKHPEVDTVVSFASLRSAYENTMEVLEFNQIRSISIIAEGIPENMTRKIIAKANEKGVTIIGPATVGGLKPGCFKIGNAGGVLDNILHSKLYRPGSVAYVSRSGGMSNELNNIIARATDGVFEGIAIGGDRYPGSTFMDHIMRYQNDPNVKLIVLLGEVGGIVEYDVCTALQDGHITKPLVAWCIGTCATVFSSNVQFGHAGSCANSDRETATAKNLALRKAGANVPDSFDTLGDVIASAFNELVQSGVVVPAEEVEPPIVPMDYAWARELGLIRKPASFMTTICDERGQELKYAGVPISDVLKKDIGIGGVISLLWFQRTLPPYACKFFEMCLMVTADHGPAVSGAHNTIVCARAGKDMISSLVSGLMTIGDRFGGALDGAAKQFSEAFDANLHPMEFVNAMRKKGELIMGIGHRVKSINNPDVRVKIIKEFVMEHFPNKPLLEYALEVEKITTSKKPNLILNVDGVIATAFVDMLRHCESFTREEAQEYIDIGAINSLFVLGRSVGFIGHYMDQNRLKQGLYRHPWDDISYISPESN